MNAIDFRKICQRNRFSLVVLYKFTTEVDNFISFKWHMHFIGKKKKKRMEDRSLGRAKVAVGSSNIKVMGKTLK